MEFNMITPGIELIGTTIKHMDIVNEIADLSNKGEREFGLNINEPSFEIEEDGIYSGMIIDIEINIAQDGDQKCKIDMSIEGAFLSRGQITEEEFKRLVIINGAAALIGVARGKLEAVTANIFNNGKIVIPFINVIDYYRNLASD